MSPRKTTKKTGASQSATDTLVKPAKTVKKKIVRAKKQPKAIAVPAANITPAVAPKAAAAPSKPYVVIDFPVTSETVSGLHYAIRMGSSDDNNSVQIQFNGGEWLPCRSTAGYWWYDWGYFIPGTYKIVARLVDAEGNQIKKTSITKIEVV